MPTPAPNWKLPRQRSCDVLILGAGIIGLSAALEVARHGLSVIVLEQGVAMREASWAAAGMLAAHDPENPRALAALAQFSLSLYEGFLADVERLSGISIPLHTTTTWQGSHRGAVETGSQTPALLSELPQLSPGSWSFIRLDEHSLDPRELCRALPLAVVAAGVILVEQVCAVQVQAGLHAVEVRTDQGAFTGKACLHCCGAWGGRAQVFDLSQGMDPGASQVVLPIEPRKGQMVSVRMPLAAPQLSCVVRTPELYLVPRGDGRIVVGATVERAGFDRSVSPAATDALLAEAAELWPPLRLGSVVDRWSGLRPATPDALPILDRLAPHTWIAAGHFRNGILLAPATAHLLAQMVLGQAPQIDLSPFRLTRFQAATTGSITACDDKGFQPGV